MTWNNYVSAQGKSEYLNPLEPNKKRKMQLDNSTRRHRILRVTSNEKGRQIKVLELGTKMARSSVMNAIKSRDC